jgi:hypothetical protein
LETSASGITTSKYEVRDWLDSIEINLDKTDEALGQSQEEDET